MKICTKCKIEKLEAEFSKKTESSDGFAHECKKCSSDRNRQYRIKNRDALISAAKSYYIDNKESLSEKAKEYRDKNRIKILASVKAYQAKNSQKISEKKKESHENNKLSVNAKSREYYSKNKERICEQKKIYRSENSELVINHNRNARARKRGAEGRHTAAAILAIFEAQRGVCANCQARLFKSGANKYHVDHIMPLALGGSNWPGNLQCLCKACNLSKNAKDPIEWAQENGRLL
jgi:5-methylcytosine-specific restriction endonuclease McrA